MLTQSALPATRLATENRQGQRSAQNHLLTCNEWDNTIRWTPGDRLQHLFEKRVDDYCRAGQAAHLAVDNLVDDTINGTKTRWSYLELDNRANQMARLLLSQGMRSGDVIGLLFDKSVHSYVAMLAVLKINAAYVPLDPAFPADRIGYIASDANLKQILTLSPYQALTAESPLSVICMDKIAAQIDLLLDHRLSEIETGPAKSELCYIIYTSGSTGRPKGVPIEQSSICNFVQVAAEVYGYQPSDRVYQGLTIAFDFAVEEIWVPLVVGATLLPNSTGSSLLGCDLADFLIAQKATAMCCVPTLLATIEEDLPELRLLIVSGEACPQDLIARWHSPERTILNAYGPTETTVTATIARSTPDMAVTIGKPLPTYSVIILEPNSENVLPFGEEGEIAVAGIGVAQGYLNRDDQTKKAFIHDFLEITNNSSGLIYRTGDLGVVNKNGDIEYRGRIDLQVKIRGYRIELAEIESVLMAVPEIAQAVVESFEPQTGIKELVAYYTLNDATNDLSQESLTQQLREVLPDYMVPAYYELLDIMPMMASDKADRKALPKPTSNRMNVGNHDFVAAQTATEKVVSTALADLLSLDKVSVEDDFFADLGTSSLLMARFCAGVRDRIPEVDISMRDVYAFPTINTLAEHLDNSLQNQLLASLDQTETVNSKRKRAAFRIPSNWDYYRCGTLQLMSYLLFLFIGVESLLVTGSWIGDATDPVAYYLRLSSVLSGLFFGWTAVAIALKWLVIGKWKADEIPIWSMKYYRFWIMKQIIQVNPMALFKGYPLYTFYLRLMGAKIGRNVVIECHIPPLCADLISIGDNTILRNDSLLITYKAISNTIYTGSITLGENVIVGEGSVLDINTVMEDDAQLGHASCLCEGQTVPKGKRFHGNPAEETDTDFRSNDQHTVTAVRQIVYSLGQLLNSFFGIVPVMIIALFMLISKVLPEQNPLTSAWAFHLLWMAAIAYIGIFIIRILLNTLVPRVLNHFLVEERSYPLYGLHFMLFKRLQKLGHSSGLTLLFGDSSYIVHYMKLVGYKLSKVIQTGSNFGLEHKHDNPYLCHIGSGTMISDGFSMLNIHESSTAFRLSKTSVGNDNFVGNNVYYPAEGKTGNNCLIATKAMVPVDGNVRENVGILGSPSFLIPRILEPDAQDNIEPANRAVKKGEGLIKKNKHNMTTIFLFLTAGFLYFYSTMLVVFGIVQSQDLTELSRLGIAFAFMLFSVGYFIFWERAAFSFRKMKPITVSIYDPRYWQVERVWKFSESFLRRLWLGTPFRSLIHRLLGIKVGKKLYDDGLYASEKTLVEIGDYCNFNINSVLQSHSLEDGIYKSDRIKLGDRCSIESKAFVHYGVSIGNDVQINADSFVMKGEVIADQSVWGGNPAKAIKIGVIKDVVRQS